MGTRLRDNIRNLIDLTAEAPGSEPRSTPVPEPRPSHPKGCGCIECFNAGLRYGEYLKAKRLQEL